MLRKYCLETGKSWDEGIPFVLFAARESVQDSLGFSPAELVFGHTLRGPVKALKERFLSAESPTTNVLDYVCQFREQMQMKKRFNQSAVPRKFEAGDNVLVLLPIPGSSLSAHFSGPYSVQQALNDTDYVIQTPDRRRKTRVCHVNMIKPYHPRAVSTALITGCGATAVATAPAHLEEEDGLFAHPSSPTARLSNSAMLDKLPDSLPHLADAQKRNLVDLVAAFPCLFGDVPSQTTVLCHDIDVPYHVSPTKRELMKKDREYLLENGLAEPSLSAWSSPCLLEGKLDGTPRFITDFRKVNAVTVMDWYPLPRMEDCVDTLGNTVYASKLDWQVPLTARASEVSAFVTPDHFLQYTVMAFGMCNALVTFQRLVNTLLAGVTNCNAYLDDLMVYSSTWEQHFKGDSLREVFSRLVCASFTLSLAKCEFGKGTVTYLGRQVGQGQVQPIEEKVRAITKFLAPTTRLEFRRFLGMTGYYRAFCRNFSAVVQPLTSLTGLKVPFRWTPECQHPFESVKALLCHAPVLSAPDFGKLFRVEVDASAVGAGAVGAGAVLLQDDQNGVEHPVSFFSHRFNIHQCKYSTIEKETLALLWALQHFEVYVGSSSLPLVIYTDHNPLTFLSCMYNYNQRLMRWALQVQDRNLVIKHKKGSENVVADTLSRV